MLKFLIVGIAVALLLWWLFGRAARRGASDARKPEQGQLDAEAMVSCAQCGVHLPRSEALAARGLHYCSPSHRDGTPPAT